jgi:hypothetical protein
MTYSESATVRTDSRDNLTLEAYIMSYHRLGGLKNSGFLGDEFCLPLLCTLVVTDSTVMCLPSFPERN